jgi:hypothetical protein
MVAGWTDFEFAPEFSIHAHTSRKEQTILKLATLNT